MLIVVRHGRTATNAEGRLLGRADPPLDATGAIQAAAAASAVRAEFGPPGLVVSSPLQRCRQTADGLGAPVTLDPRWVELDYGELEGRPLAEVPPEVWKAWRSDVDFAAPGGETLRALGARVRAALDDLAPRAEDDTVVVVTHVSPVKAALAWTLGVGDEVAWRAFVAPASITVVAMRGGLPSLHRFNDTAHLRSS